jgi:hypothetical protein
MNKILFLTTLISGIESIFDKVTSQCESIKSLNYLVDLVYVGEKFELFINENQIGNLYSKIGIQFLYFTKVSQNINFYDYSIVYIRNPFVLNQISYLHFLRKAKYSNCKVILEIPTYPYKLELNTFRSKMMYFNEMLYVKKLKKYISLILYSGNYYSQIYEIPCKQIFNVGNNKTIPLANSNKVGNIINVVGVSGCAIYHAYERIIEGLYHYYNGNPTFSVRFHIVGVGPYLELYKSYVDKFLLNKYVIFHGQLFGEKLDSLFSEINIGISCLGMHRIGLNSGSPLKSSEYALRGIPFVLAYRDLIFSNEEFAYEVPANDQAIEINKIIQWYTSKKFDNKLIRDYTLNNISWENQFKNIFTDIT